MNQAHFWKSCGKASAALIFFGLTSCIEVDTQFGIDLIPRSHTYDIYTAEFPITDIRMEMVDSLSGFSQTRITVGSIRDEDFGLTKRSCALTLVPINDSLDFGKNPKFKRFHFTVAHDTLSYAQETEKHILQNINVYELSKPFDFNMVDLNGTVEHGKTRITRSIPLYDGKDSLSFDFSRSFGEKYMKMTIDDLVDMDTYLAKFPGIYLETDDPQGIGGRINMFNLQLGVNTSYGYISKDYAKLSFEAEYDGERKDSAFLFYLSPNKMYDLDSLVDVRSSYTSSGYEFNFPQYCFNFTQHQTRNRAGAAKEKIQIEGGGGLKAMIPAEDLRAKIVSEISKHGNPSQAIINRATIILPFEFPDDYTQMYKYPEYLNPTCRISGEDYVAYGSLSDTSSESEDPGKINRSTLQYKPDVTYHIQQLVNANPDDVKMSNYDIWFLLMSSEVTETDSSESDSSSSLYDYYNALAYSSYYNNMYGGYGGYGGYGYGGYGSYGYGNYGGYGYSNYYNYALASMYASQNQGTSTSTSIEMDTSRYFNAVLNGPEAKNGRVPMFRIVYAIPKE